MTSKSQRVEVMTSCFIKLVQALQQSFSYVQGPQRSDAGEARTPGPSVSSKALYH